MTSVVVDGPGLFSDADYAMAASVRGENQQFVVAKPRSVCS